jgi:hypothetical protein
MTSIGSRKRDDDDDEPPPAPAAIRLPVPDTASLQSEMGFEIPRAA